MIGLKKNMRDILKTKCKKVPYKTRAEAISITKYHGEASFGKPYRCKICEKIYGYKVFHLGHKKPKKTLENRLVKIERIKKRSDEVLQKLVEHLCGDRN